MYIAVVVQSLSPVWLLVNPWTATRQTSLSFTISWSLVKLLSIESVMQSNYLILCCPLLLLPSIIPSIRVFSNETGGQSIRASASASVLPMKIQDWFPLELIGLISLRSRGLSRVFSTPQFKSMDSSVLCLLYTNCLENHFNDFLFRVLNMHHVRVPV